MLLLAATASPAAAKGPAEVAVSGPGVATTLNYYTKSVVDVDLGSLGEAARIFDIYGTSRPEPKPGVAVKALGARYVLTWDLGENDVVQHAYPFAEGGAWVRFLPGHDMFGKPVADGWVSAPALTEQLVELGAVDKSTESAEAQVPALSTAEPEAAPVVGAKDEPGGGTSYGVAVWAGAALAAALAAGVVLLWRRRLSR
jgi:hypothetical protein